MSVILRNVKRRALLSAALAASIIFSLAAEDRFLDDYRPADAGIVVRHGYYDLAFDPVRKTPYWTVYRVDKDRAEDRFSRKGMSFVKDPSLGSDSPDPDDYKGGRMSDEFDTGHLVPADDMRFDLSALRETFYISNAVPQAKGCNRGVWKRIENRVDALAMDGFHLVVISGPVYLSDQIDFLKDGRVAVPDALFKIIIDVDGGGIVAFLVPNNGSKGKPAEDFTVPVELVESVVGLALIRGRNGAKSVEKNGDGWFWTGPMKIKMDRKSFYPSTF